MPNDKPILFTTPMVQAILEGRKTMTRRVIKPQLEKDETWDGGYKYSHRGATTALSMLCAGVYDRTSPYQPGDILWVRETWARGRVSIGEEPDGRDSKPYISQCIGDNDIIPKEAALREGICIDEVVWRPSIFMPKEACRIWLRVLAVRPERLQEISEEDAIAEGIEAREPNHVVGARYRFGQLWNSINAARGYGWDKNPWVWAIIFERCDKPAGWPGRS